MDSTEGMDDTALLDEVLGRWVGEDWTGWELGLLSSCKDDDHSMSDTYIDEVIAR